MMPETPEVLRNSPCLRSGLMWGITTGLLIGGHRYRTTKLVNTACDWAVMSFGAVATGTWVVCRTARQQRVQQTRQFMEVMNDPSRKAEAEQFLRSRVQTQEQQPQENGD